jgi:lysophospholipase L1-like esterase
VRLFRQGSADWVYDYKGEPADLTGLTIDWGRKVAQFPARLTSSQRDLINKTLFTPRPPDLGHQREYFRYWFGRIVDRYRDSGTKIIFLRVPRAPDSPPDHPPSRDSSIRQLASRPNVIVLDEHLFDTLERPEFFGDPLHLNGEGMVRFSRILATELRHRLGSPRLGAI